MKLKLDKKIESLSDIFNFSDVEKAKQFMEQKQQVLILSTTQSKH